MCAVETVLGVHDALLGLEPKATRSNQVWHMLVSLREFCVFNELSFDDILAEVKEHEAELTSDKVSS